MGGEVPGVDGMIKFSLRSLLSRSKSQTPPMGAQNPLMSAQTPLSLSLSKAPREASPARVLRQAQHERTLVHGQRTLVYGQRTLVCDWTSVSGKPSGTRGNLMAREERT